MSPSLNVLVKKCPRITIMDPPKRVVASLHYECILFWEKMLLITKWHANQYLKGIKKFFFEIHIYSNLDYLYWIVSQFSTFSISTFKIHKLLFFNSTLISSFMFDI